MIFYLFFVDNLNEKLSSLNTTLVVCLIGHIYIVYKVVCSHSYGSQLHRSFIVTVLSSWSYGLHYEFGKLTITLLWHIEPYIYQYQSDHTYLFYICDTLISL